MACLRHDVGDFYWLTTGGFARVGGFHEREDFQRLGFQNGRSFRLEKLHGLSDERSVTIVSADG